MTKFDCDNKDIEKTLRSLYKLVIENGGIIHDGLTIRSNNGELQINASDEILSGEEIITLPKECLLPVNKFKLDLDGFNIVVLSHDKDLSDGQVAMMEAMIELFNLTGKIQAHEQTSTFSLHYKNKDLLDKLLKSRSKNEVSFVTKIEGMGKNSFYLESYLNTRTLGIKETGKENKVKFIMPFIEFLNHHIKSSLYTPSYTEMGSPAIGLKNELTHVTVMKSCPVEGSKECHVCYGPFDSMDMLIHYNYPDSSAFFVRSVPVKVCLPNGNGTIEINSKSPDRQQKDLPDKLKGIEFYIPAITVNIVKDVVSLDFIYIPPNNSPNAMRRVLALALSQLELKLTQDQMIDLLRFAEKIIINENIKYFEEFSEYLKNYKPEPVVKIIAENISDVVATQLHQIKNYKVMA